MKRVLIPIIFSAMSVLMYAYQADQSERYTLKVSVSDLHNSKGVVQFALYNKDGSIPDEEYKNFYKLVKSEIENNSASAEFKNIPKGKYAVNILHDENKNGKIDKGWVLPIEGIGFSNFSTIGFSNRPNFEKASFDLKTDRAIKVKVIYM